MAADFSAVFLALKRVFTKRAKLLAVLADTPVNYALATKSASPFPQHKGRPLDFGCVKVGKAYVSLHLMPLYMCPVLTKTISPALKKRMQGKACFNFTSPPEPDLLAELDRLVEQALTLWAEKNWL
jgi:hypothetical protein